jgi:periplasmic protein CpxP/Spy
MTNPLGRVALLAVAALLSLPSAAPAQPASAPGTTGSAAPAANPAPSTPVQERVEARIKQLHAQLHITPAEEPQWHQFAQTMRDNAREIDAAALQRAQQYPTMTAVQNMESYEKLAEAHVQRLQKLIPAFQGLYDVMPPDQKQIADQVFRARAQAHARERSSRNQQAQYSPGYHHRWYHHRHHWWGSSQAEELNSEELARLAAGR